VASRRTRSTASEVLPSTSSEVWGPVMDLHDFLEDRHLPTAAFSEGHESRNGGRRGSVPVGGTAPVEGTRRGSVTFEDIDLHDSEPSRVSTRMQAGAGAPRSFVMRQGTVESFLEVPLGALPALFSVKDLEPGDHVEVVGWGTGIVYAIVTTGVIVRFDEDGSSQMFDTDECTVIGDLVTGSRQMSVRRPVSMRQKSVRTSVSLQEAAAQMKKAATVAFPQATGDDSGILVDPQGPQDEEDGKVHSVVSTLTNALKTTWLQHPGDACVGDLYMPEVLSAMGSFASVLRALGPAMALGRKDFENNLAKARDHYTRSGCGPSFREFLEWERDTGLHQPGGMITGPSGVEGLLWMRRSIDLVAVMMAKMLEGLDTKPAIQASYTDTLQPYHKFLLRSTFGAVFRGTPPKQEFLLRLAPSPDASQEERRDASWRDIGAFVKVAMPILKTWKDLFVELDLEDSRKI